MALVCPQCKQIYDKISICPLCSVVLLYHAQNLQSDPASSHDEDEVPQWQHTPWGKILVGLIPPWDHEPPIWELRSGEFRVFYDVNETDSRVTVRAIRRKPPHRTTEEIL